MKPYILRVDKQVIQSVYYIVHADSKDEAARLFYEQDAGEVVKVELEGKPNPVGDIVEILEE